MRTLLGNPPWEPQCRSMASGEAPIGGSCPGRKPHSGGSTPRSTMHRPTCGCATARHCTISQPAAQSAKYHAMSPPCPQEAIVWQYMRKLGGLVPSGSNAFMRCCPCLRALSKCALAPRRRRRPGRARAGRTPRPAPARRPMPCAAPTCLDSQRTIACHGLHQGLQAPLAVPTRWTQEMQAGAACVPSCMNISKTPKIGTKCQVSHACA